MVEITEELINNVLDYEILKPVRELFNGWIILIDGKVFKIPNGRFIFTTRQQAVKSFYNTMRWRLICKIYQTSGQYSWGEASQYWKSFKAALRGRIKIENIQFR